MLWSNKAKAIVRYRLLEPSHIVIPYLIRDLDVDLIQGRVYDLGRATKDGFSQRPAGLRTSAQSGS